MHCDAAGKLQWESDIPQDALDNLQSLANSDFHKNLGKIIHDIYLTGHNLFKDMPQGDADGSLRFLGPIPAHVPQHHHHCRWPQEEGQVQVRL